MIQQQTVLKVSDNSGAKTVKCIKVLNGFKKKHAKLGDYVIVSVQQLRSKFKTNSKVKKGEVYRALIIRSKIGRVKKDYIKTVFDENSVILVNKQLIPIGTRIIGPLPKFFKKKKFQKFISISFGVV
uniref:Ribosomal protein L14 n=1 Tax=Proschkinia sp. SZCZR1824 TaxID=2588390 RepID=A0A4Y5SE11_9STRA|nr:ribosomal protein L14 [Proschkinia sp. SZCZR1824]